MQPRINLMKTATGAYQAMSQVEKYLHGCGLDHKFIHMLKLCASQINGCAYCIDMHWKDAIAAGETVQRLYGLDAWEESPYYNDKERAALAWVEALTNIRDGHAPDDVYAKVREHYSEEEVANLTWLTAAINAWNRVAIGVRSPAGLYQPPKKHE